MFMMLILIIAVIKAEANQPTFMPIQPLWQILLIKVESVNHKSSWCTNELIN